MEQRFPKPTGIYVYLIVELAIFLMASAQVVSHAFSYELSFFAREICLAWYALLHCKLNKPYWMAALLAVLALAVWIYLA